MIWRAARTCCGVALGQPARPDPERVLEADADVAAERGRHASRSASGCGRRRARPEVVVAEQAVGGALHVHDVLRMRADAAEDAEHRLDEQRRLDQAAVDEMRAACRGGRCRSTRSRSACRWRRTCVRMYVDVAERVPEDAVVEAREVGPLPVVLELLEARQHREQAEIHRAHVERRDLRLEMRAGCRRSSTVIVGAPPVVMLMTTFDALLDARQERANASGLWSGGRSAGSRACRCTIAAPASRRRSPRRRSRRA